jgi:large subunit ribosomal protein L10
MLTKQEKQESVATAEALIGKSSSLLFADFTGIPTSALRKLRIIMRAEGGSFGVFKKRLMKIALKNKGVQCDPTAFERQAGMIAVRGDLYAAAAKVYALIKELAKIKHDLTIVGGYDIERRSAISAEQFVAMAKLPSRETLLTQLAFMLTMPVRKTMVALTERAKTVGA